MAVMENQKRTQMVLGLVLVIAGALFLVGRVLNLTLAWPFFGWPMMIVAVGVGLLLLGLLVGAPDMAIPASIVSGIGGILAYQYASGDWASWAYLWALIPVFVGMGMILAAAIAGRPLKAYMEAFGPIGFGVVFFVILGAFFGGFRGSWGVIAPALLIVIGAILLGRNFLRK
jgi:hypothetical protein